MADLTQDPLTADGYYEFPTKPGEEYLAAFDGVFDGAEANLEYQHPASGDWGSAEGISINGATPVTQAFPSFLAPGNRMRWGIATAGAGTHLYISVTPILR